MAQAQNRPGGQQTPPPGIPGQDLNPGQGNPQYTNPNPQGKQTQQQGQSSTEHKDFPKPGPMNPVADDRESKVQTASNSPVPGEPGQEEGQFGKTTSFSSQEKNAQEDEQYQGNKNHPDKTSPDNDNDKTSPETPGSRESAL